jgi:hypothetical protein
LVNNKPKSFEEGKRAAWVSIWTLLGIGAAEIVTSTSMGSLTFLSNFVASHYYH